MVGGNLVGRKWQGFAGIRNFSIDGFYFVSVLEKCFLFELLAWLFMGVCAFSRLLFCRERFFSVTFPFMLNFGIFS